MRENLKSVLLVFIGVIVGIILYFQFIEKGNADKNINDSLFVSDVQAQDDKLAAANEAISNSRRNIITEAIEKISPAIVSVNVLAVKEYRSRSPFRSRDPILREFFQHPFSIHIMIN